MVGDGDAFDNGKERAVPGAAHGLALPVTPPFRHRVTPYAFLLHGRRVKRLAAVEARIVELESALQAVDEKVIRDPLTGAFNRRGMNEMFAREAALAQRIGQPLALALIELNDFKSISAQHGQVAGDAALVRLVQVISKTLRPTDLCARWGGSEFVVLMLGADCKFAQRALARVQEAFAAQPVATASVNLAFRAGVVQRGEGESLERMLVRAAQLIDHAPRASEEFQDQTPYPQIFCQS